jgi:hypothetical protein
MWRVEGLGLGAERRGRGAGDRVWVGGCSICVAVEPQASGVEGLGLGAQRGAVGGIVGPTARGVDWGGLGQSRHSE